MTVNGVIVTELGTKADPEVDEIFVDGSPLKKSRRLLYLLLNKPKGYVTTVSDPEGRATVMDLLPSDIGRVYPVGRLDYGSEGLLLMTNDGDLAQVLMKAGSHVPKTYLVKVSGRPAEKDIARLRAGISIPLEDGRRVKTSPAKNPLGGKHTKSVVRGDSHRRPQSSNSPHVQRSRLRCGEDQARAAWAVEAGRRAGEVPLVDSPGSRRTQSRCEKPRLNHNLKSPAGQFGSFLFAVLCVLCSVGLFVALLEREVEMNKTAEVLKLAAECGIRYAEANLHS